MLELASQAETFVWEYIETRTTIGDIEKGKRSQYWTTLKEKNDRAKKTTINMQNWGNYFYLYGCDWW